jgi:hypothetical protein
MSTAEMQTLPNPSTMNSAAHSPASRAKLRPTPSADAHPPRGGSSSTAPPPTPVWMVVLMVCLAAASLGASLAYMGTAERPPAAAYALDRDWSATSPLGVDPARPAAPPMAIPAPVCDTCGRVEAVVAMARPAGARSASADNVSAEGGKARVSARRPMFEIQVRMQDGHTRTVHADKPLAVGTPVTLENGVLRPDNA